LVLYLQLAAGMALFGSALPVAKLVGGEFPVFVGSALRTAIGALVLLPFVVSIRSNSDRTEQRDWWLLGLLALFGMFGFSVLMLYGMALTSGVVGSIVMSTTPAITALGAFLFLKERLGWRKALAAALAVAGVLILQLTGGMHHGEHGAGRSSLLGPAFVFAAVCCEAAYTLIGKPATDRLGPIRVAFWSAILSLPLFLPLAAWELRDFDWRQTSVTGWLYMLWWGAGTLGLGSALWYTGVAKAEASVAAGFMGVMPVSALVLSYLLLGEQFRWAHLTGFAVVFTGVVLIAREHSTARH